MLAVKGIYDGKAAIPEQPVSITGWQEVIITFLKPIRTQTTGDIKEKRKILESLVGLVPANIDESAIKTERLARQ